MDFDEIRDAILAETLYASIATVDAAGTPWVTPVYFALDRHGRFYWVSGIDARHSVNISETARVAIVVYNSQLPVGEGQGVYVGANALELGVDDLALGTQVFYTRRYPDEETRAKRGRAPGDFLTPSPRRMYRADPFEWFILDPAGHPEHGSLLDYRTPVVGPGGSERDATSRGN
jgi:uncharacterized protein YhbP (UPF0306 family)